MARGIKKRKVISLKKRLLVVSGFFVFFILLGIGFSSLTTGLSINGDVDVYAPLEPTLYNVFVKNARKGTYVREYTGEHQDSMNPSLSTEKIYHWYAANDNEANRIIEMNNVVFAGYCWQMVRTTDTGGVKLLFNGTDEEGKCPDTKSRAVDSYSYGTYTMSSSYNYGTDYVYDSDTNKYSLSGNISLGTAAEGTYTCMGSSSTYTCNTLYYLAKHKSGNSYYAFILGRYSNAFSIGYLPFNYEDDSLSDNGYLSGDTYLFQSKYYYSGSSFSIKQTLISLSSFANENYYSKEILDNNNSYSLVDAQSGYSVGSDKSGYYTIRSAATSGTSLYYLIALSSGNNYYYTQLDYPQQPSSLNMMIGDSIIDNGNDTYTLDNTFSISIDDWYINYSNYVGMYTCGDAVSITCSNPRYIHEAYKTYYNYIDSGEKILIAKEKNGLQLSNTKTIRYDDFIINKANYSDYKYTCGTTGNICTEENFKTIKSINASGYSYYPNTFYSTYVTWEDNKYTLVDAVDKEHHDEILEHYSCIDPGVKTCSNVAFFYGAYYTSDDYPRYYITLSNGEMIDDVINNMTNKSDNSSAIKDALEHWYSRNLIDYDQYIDDTIFCQKRSVYNYGGFGLNGRLANVLLFDDANINGNLNCPRNVDRLSVSNPNGRLKYKIGLMTTQEMYLANNENVNVISTAYSGWFLISPEEYYNTPQMGSYATASYVNRYGKINQGGTSPVTTSKNVRPAISLIPGIRYTSGDGSKDNPFVVDTN